MRSSVLRCRPKARAAADLLPWCRFMTSEKFPATKVLYVTGYDDPAADCPMALRADDEILRKPFSSSTLAWTVHRWLEEPADVPMN
jgi:hypothetical protein